VVPVSDIAAKALGQIFARSSQWYLARSGLRVLYIRAFACGLC